MPASTVDMAMPRCAAHRKTPEPLTQSASPRCQPIRRHAPTDTGHQPPTTDHRRQPARHRLHRPVQARRHKLQARVTGTDTRKEPSDPVSCDRLTSRHEPQATTRAIVHDPLDPLTHASHHRARSAFTASSKSTPSRCASAANDRAASNSGTGSAATRFTLAARPRPVSISP